MKTEQNKTNTAPQKIGEITEGKVLFSMHVGRATEDDGREVELLVGVATSSPMVRYKNKHFILPWRDIIKLAENAGLFEEAAPKMTFSGNMESREGD